MSDYTLAALPWASLTAQPGDVRGLPETERDALIISATQVDGQWVIRSRYGEDTWHLDGFTSNISPSQHWLNFSSVPPAFRAAM